MSGALITYSGVSVDVEDVRVEDVRVEDIARSLSMQCRWNGHVRAFYSIAEHCVRCADIVDAESAAWALMHDAAETYIGDIVVPVKAALSPGVELLEARIVAAVAAALSLGERPACVGWADLKLLATEARDLVPGFRRWDLLPEQPLERRIKSTWSPEQAEVAFLRRWEEVRPR